MVLVLDRPLSSKYWMNIGDSGLPFVAIIEHTNMIDKSLYGGNHVVYISNYPSRESELYQKSGAELLEEFVPHLRKINPEFDPSWVLEYHHHKVDGAQPIVAVDYGQHIPDHRTPFKNLYLANTTQIYPEDRGTKLLGSHGPASGENGVGGCGRVGAVNYQLSAISWERPLNFERESK